MGIGLGKKDTAQAEGTVNSSATLRGQIVRLDECHECATIDWKGHGKPHHLDPDRPWTFLHGPSTALFWLPTVLSLSLFLGLSTAVK